MKYFLSVGFLLMFGLGFTQEPDLVTLDGYVYESGNRGYLNEVKITVTPKNDPNNAFSIRSNRDGFFTLGLPKNQTFVIKAEKQLFHPTSQDLSTHTPSEKGKVFSKIQLNRKPGYLFDVTLAVEKDSGAVETDAISGALIEIYNNTTRQEELVLKDYPDPNFAFTFQKGNHYTLLIRKEGFFSKRLEAFVDVDGCILCFDGLASIENVTDNLTEGLTMGSLLANIELRKATLGTTFKVENIFYDLDKANIRSDAAAELDKLVIVLRDNPSIQVELGSHTDSRGDDDYNEDLSERRAKAAVSYLLKQGLSPNRIEAKGYGETELTNGCSEGVNCTPEQHQENRRTEIKVIGLGERSQMDAKSLADLKHEENFETLLEEIQNQEVIEYRPGDDMPEDLRRMIEAQASKKQEDSIRSGAGTLVVLQDSMTHSSSDHSEGQVGAPLDQMAGKEKPVESDHQVADVPATSADGEKEKKAPVMDLKVARDGSHRFKREDFDKQAAREQAVIDALGDKPKGRAAVPKMAPKEVAQNESPLLSIPEDFTGFMIEVKRQIQTLDPNDKVFTLFGDIYQQDLVSGENSFLIAGFDDFEHCYLFFEQKVLESYPDAKIIEFLSGTRL